MAKLSSPISWVNRKLTARRMFTDSQIARLAANPVLSVRLAASSAEIATNPPSFDFWLFDILAQQSLRTNEEHENRNEEHGDSGLRGIEIETANALDDGDEDGTGNGAHNAAQAAHHDGDEAPDQVVVAHAWRDDGNRSD